MEDKGTPLSTIIRNRIKSEGARFYANDNISRYIHNDEEIHIYTGFKFLELIFDKNLRAKLNE